MTQATLVKLISQLEVLEIEELQKGKGLIIENPNNHT